MAKKTWIEVALNGAWTRRLQPNIPVTAQEIVNEGVACVKAGAAVIHAHTLDPDTGKQNNNLENCIAFIGGIRSPGGCDCISHRNADSLAGRLGRTLCHYR